MRAIVAKTLVLAARAGESLAARTRRATERRELAAINRHVDELNAEAEDVLAYQVKL